MPDNQEDWNLKSFLHQKLFDLGLVRRQPGEILSDQQKWVANTDRLRRRLFQHGLSDDRLEEIFEEEDNKWTLRTYLRVKRFALGVTFDRMTRVFKSGEERWAALEYLSNFFHEFGLTGTRLKQIAIAIGAILGVTLVAWMVRFDSGSRTDVENVEVVSKTIDIDEELEVLADIRFENGGSPLNVQRDIEARKAKIELLRQQKNITDSQKSRLALLQLRIQRGLVFVFLENGIDSDVEMLELESFAKSVIANGDSNLRQAADFTLCAVDVKEFSVKVNEENAQAARESLTQYEGSYLNLPDNSVLLLAMLVEARQRNPGSPIVDDCIAHLGGILEQSDDVATQNAAKSIIEQMRFAKFGLASLEQRIRSKTPGALEDLQGAVELLRRNPESMLLGWLQSIRACEALIAVSNNEEFVQVRNSLCEIATSIPEASPLKEKVQALLDRQQTRTSAVGETLDISGDAAYTKKRLQDSVSGYSLIMFADSSKRSIEVLQRLADNSMNLKKKCTTIVAFKQGTFQTDPKKIPLLAKNLLIASEETSEKYFNQIPMDFIPQGILLDDQGTIVATNLFPAQVAGRIKAHQPATVEK